MAGVGSSSLNSFATHNQEFSNNNGSGNGNGNNDGEEGEEDMGQCFEVLGVLKKHEKAYPFLEPVDPKTSGALDYF